MSTQDALSIGGFVGSIVAVIPGLQWVGIGILIADAMLGVILAPDAQVISAYQMVSLADAHLPVIYGTTRAGTYLTFPGVGNAGTDLWLVCAIGHGEIDAITGIYLDGNLAVDATGAVRGDPVAKTLGANTLETPCRISCTGHGLVPGDTVTIAGHAGLNGDWVVGDTPDANTFLLATTATAVVSGGTATRKNPGYTGLVSFAKYRGKDTQDMTSAPGTANGPTADSTLRASDLTAAIPSWSPSHKGQGVAYVIVKLTYNTDKFSGIPEVTVSARGRKVYDPRNATTAYSANAALCLRDLVTSTRYGVGGSVYDGDATDGWWAEANYCDEMVDGPATTGMGQITGTNASTDAVATAAAHNLLAGDRVWIRNQSGTTPDINGTKTVKTVVDATHFTLDNGSGGTLNITVGGGNSGSVQKIQQAARFETHGVVDTGNSLQTNCEGLLMSCRGALTWREGFYRLFIRRAKAYSYLDAPTNTRGLDESAIIGDWDFTFPGARTAPNALRVTYPSKASNYETDVTDWPLPATTTQRRETQTNPYLAADNNVLNRREITFPYVVSTYQVQQLEMELLEEARNAVIASVTCKEEVLKLAVGDVVPVTMLPWWNAKPFWVMGLGILPTREVRVSLMQYVATCYDNQMTDDVSYADGSALPLPWDVHPPTAPVEGMLSTGTRDPRILVQWMSSPTVDIAKYEVQAKRTAPAAIADATWRDCGMVPADTLTTYVGPAGTGETWQAQVRAVTRGGRKSEWLVSESEVTDIVPAAGFTASRTTQSNAVTYTMTFGDGCQFIELYTVEHVGTGGENPPLTDAYRVATLTRPTGGSLDVVQAVPTTPNWYRRTILVGWTASWEQGVVIGFYDDQAYNAGSGPSGAPGRPVFDSATQNTVTFHFPDTDPTAHTRVYCEGGILKTLDPGVHTGVVVDGLEPDGDYQIKLDHVKNDQASGLSGITVMNTLPLATAPTTFTNSDTRLYQEGAKWYCEQTFSWSGGSGGAWEIRESQVNDVGQAHAVASGGSGTSTTITRLQAYTPDYYYWARYTNPLTDFTAMTGNPINYSGA